MSESTGTDVQAFSVFSHNHEVDVVVVFARERRGDAGLGLLSVYPVPGKDNPI